MYDTNLQKLYLGVMLSDGDLLTKVKSITKPSLFSRELQKVVSEVMNYVDEYDGIPDPTYVQTKTNVEIKVPNKVDDSIRDWFMDEYPKFCLHKALEEAVIKSTELIESEDYDGVEELIKKAQETRLVQDYGLDYSENPKERLQAIKDRSGNISTGFKTLDDIVGKLNIGDLIIYAGGPGSGKSLFLQNNSLHHYSVEGKNVMYITLELNADLCAQRIDSMLLEQPTKRLYENLDATDQVIRKKTRQFESENGGMLKIKHMPSGSTTSDVKSFVKDFMVTTGNKIDVLVIDYLDLLNPAQKVQLGDVFQKDKAVSEEIRNIAQEMELVSITASQLNRCLTLNTNVVVKGKGTIELKDINVGDKILSSDGYNTVKAKTDPKKQMVYRIETAGGREVYASANHVFPSVEGERSINTGLSIADTLFINNDNIDTVEDEITSIEAIGYEDTMDIETDGNHLFFANGVLTHNSAVSQDDLDHSHIAGGISKINTADLVLGIIITDAMREKGYYELQALKVRNNNGTGKRVRLGYKDSCMKIHDDEDHLINNNSDGKTALSETEMLFNEVQNKLNSDNEHYDPIDIETGKVNPSEDLVDDGSNTINVPKEMRTGLGNDKADRLRSMLKDDDED